MADQACLGQLYSEACLVSVLQQVACGLAYLHRQGLVHRVLSPHSLFVCGSESTQDTHDTLAVKIGHLRLIDSFHKKEAMTEIDWVHPSQSRAVPYASADAVSSDLAHAKWPGCDVFAMGMVMLDLSSDSTLPQEMEDPEWQKLRCGELPGFRPGLSQEFKQLVFSLLNKQLTAKEVLSHPHVARVRNSVSHNDPQQAAELYMERVLSHRLSEVDVSRREQRARTLAKELKLRSEFDRLLRNEIDSEQQSNNISGVGSTHMSRSHSSSD